MTPERFTNLDEWSQALEPGPCKTALRELVTYVLELITDETRDKVLVGQELQKLYAERDTLRKRVAELEQRLDEVPDGWTELPPRKPGLRVRAGIAGSV